MNYPYSMPPYIQTAMAQAMQAIIAGSPLPPNCMVVTIPIQQAQQMFPQLMMNYASGGGAMTFPQQPSYYDQLYQPQISPYQNQPLPNAVVPYSNYYSQGYNQNYNQPIVPYTDYNHKSKKKNRNGKNNRLEPHSNVYNSSSFDSDMDNLSWSRLFGTHHSKQQKQDQAALNYNQKSKRRDHAADSLTSSSSSSSTTTSSSTTSDETIRRVNVSTKQPSSQSSSLKQQTKSSLPFKYSSEFVPGTGKQQQQSQKSNKKETKVKYDDVFVVKKTQPPSSSSSQQ